MKIIVTKEELRVGRKAATLLAGEFDLCFNRLWNLHLNSGRNATVCIIQHNYTYYSGVAILHPGECPTLKGVKIAFGRALNAMILDAEYQLKCNIGKGVNKVFWEKFLSELSSPV